MDSPDGAYQAQSTIMDHMIDIKTLFSQEHNNTSYQDLVKNIANNPSDTPLDAFASKDSAQRRQQHQATLSHYQQPLRDSMQRYLSQQQNNIAAFKLAHTDTEHLSTSNDQQTQELLDHPEKYQLAPGTLGSDGFFTYKLLQQTSEKLSPQENQEMSDTIARLQSSFQRISRLPSLCQDPLIQQLLGHHSSLQEHELSGLNDNDTHIMGHTGLLNTLLPFVANNTKGINKSIDLE